MKLMFRFCRTDWLHVAFFYPQESDDSVTFHKSMAMEGRSTEVQDIAPIVRFLCTAGKWVNGQTIFANGGYNGR
jgi:NAD(P)-dependent dehydrogenase (short-subunit alcohol dehydrogenase family)